MICGVMVENPFVDGKWQTRYCEKPAPFSKDDEHRCFDHAASAGWILAAISDPSVWPEIGYDVPVRVHDLD